MAQTKVKLISDGVIVQGNLHSSHGITTAHIGEGSNLYYTDARVDTRVGNLNTGNLPEGSNLYYTDARADARIAAASTSDLSEGTNLYYTDARADARVALIVDSSPATLNTLNELAAALGDDPNFAATTATSIGLKASLASPSFTGVPSFNLNDGTFTKAVNATNNVASTNVWGYGLYEGGSKLAEISLVRDGSSNQMYIGTTTANQTLRIGTANKVTALTINASQNATFAGSITFGDSHFIGDDADDNLLIQSSANENIIINSVDDLFLRTGGTTKLIVKNGGNVGIGTTDPDHKLEVVGGLALRNSNSRLYFGTNNGPDRRALEGDVNGTLLQVGEGYTDIALQGDVGIGTTNPHFNLQITGGNATEETVLKLDKGATSDTGGHTTILGLGTEGGSWAKAGIGFERTGSYDIGNIHFLMYPPGLNTGSVSLSDSVMTIKNNGNVGIGDTTPASKLVVAGRVQANSGSEPWAFVSNPTSGNYGGFLMQYGNNTKGVCYYNSNSIIVGSEGAAIPLRFTTNGNYAAHFSGTTGNMHVGGISDQDAKLYVTGGTTLAGTNNNSEGAIRMYGDRKLPQATYFVKRNYRLTASSGNALYSIARQWHDHANWGLGHINVIMWGVYYGKNNFSKADFSCRYGYSGGAADVVANFNPGSMAIPTWTAATQVSGNVHYRDLQITVPAYWQISFEIISPGCVQTYNINNTANNTVYLYPH